MREGDLAQTKRGDPAQGNAGEQEEPAGLPVQPRAAAPGELGARGPQGALEPLLGGQGLVAAAHALDLGEAQHGARPQRVGTHLGGLAARTAEEQRLHVGVHPQARKLRREGADDQRRVRQGEAGRVVELQLHRDGALDELAHAVLQGAQGQHHHHRRGARQPLHAAQERQALLPVGPAGGLAEEQVGLLAAPLAGEELAGQVGDLPGGGEDARGEGVTGQVAAQVMEHVLPDRRRQSHRDDLGQHSPRVVLDVRNRQRV